MSLLSSSIYFGHLGNIIDSGIGDSSNFIDDNGITSFIDDNGITSFTDDLGH